MPDDPNFQLSNSAFTELKEIVNDELSSEHSDKEIEEMGWNLLRVFNLLLTKDSHEPHLAFSDDELKALHYIKDCCVENKKATVRGVAKAIGKQSPRSGMRMITLLIRRGYIHRDGMGILRVLATLPKS